jgi:hypothetical protein
LSTLLIGFLRDRTTTMCSLSEKEGRVEEKEW